MFTRNSFLLAKDNCFGIFALQNTLFHKAGPQLKWLFGMFFNVIKLFFYKEVLRIKIEIALKPGVSQVLRGLPVRFLCMMSELFHSISSKGLSSWISPVMGSSLNREAACPIFRQFYLWESSSVIFSWEQSPHIFQLVVLALVFGLTEDWQKDEEHCSKMCENRHSCRQKRSLDILWVLQLQERWWSRGCPMALLSC